LRHSPKTFLRTMKNEGPLIIVIIGLIVLSALTGGNLLGVGGDRASSTPRTTTTRTTQTREPTARDISRELNKTEKEVTKLEQDIQSALAAKDASPFKGQITIRSVSGIASADPLREYITLQAGTKNSGPIAITGWRLTSLKTGRSVAIKDGVSLYFEHAGNSKETIWLKPGDKALIATGRSPIYYSFRVNKCSGYFNQFSSFSPTLSSQCPAPRDENLSSIPKNDDICLDYINRFPRCRVQTKTMPNGISGQCEEFLIKKLTYDSCVETHRSDSDFFKAEWRIYLERDESLWETKRETIQLTDLNGKLVDGWSR